MAEVSGTKRCKHCSGLRRMPCALLEPIILSVSSSTRFARRNLGKYEGHLKATMIGIATL